MIGCDMIDNAIDECRHGKIGWQRQSVARPLQRFVLGIQKFRPEEVASTLLQARSCDLRIGIEKHDKDARIPCLQLFTVALSKRRCRNDGGHTSLQMLVDPAAQ